MDIFEHLNYVFPKEKRLDFSKIELIRSELHFSGNDQPLTTFSVPLEKYLQAVEALHIAEKALIEGASSTPHP